LGALRLQAKQLLGLVVAICVLAGAAWESSLYLRGRVFALVDDVQQEYRDPSVETSTGARIGFWTMSVRAIREAPVIGHGTGSIGDVFRRQGSDTALNPHNQIFAVGIQLGMVGIAALIAMWVAHWSWFFDAAGAAWLGLVMVTQNIVGSLF